MVTVRKAKERGHFNHGWLDTYHTFSFADYYDPSEMGFGALRVINEDKVEPGRGFGMHGHRDMEIITYILEGALEHKDSMGNGSVIRPGDLQRMSAGTGVTHSEFNPSREAPVHFLQIWLLPRERGLPPGYEQKRFPQKERRGRLRLVAAGDGRDGAVTIHQDADLWTALLQPGESVRHALVPGRYAWLHVARGAVSLNGSTLGAGGGAAVSDEVAIEITGVRPSYEEKQFGTEDKKGRLRLIASPDGRDGSVTIHQDAYVYAALLDGKDAVAHRLAPGRRAYLHVARGAVKMNGIEMKGGDGAKLTEESEIEFSGAKQAELLLFDLP